MNDRRPCPRCTVDLAERKHGPQGLLACGRCGGVWLDAVACCQLVERAPAAASLLCGLWGHRTGACRRRAPPPHVGSAAEPPRTCDLAAGRSEGDTGRQRQGQSSRRPSSTFRNLQSQDRRVRVVSSQRCPTPPSNQPSTISPPTSPTRSSRPSVAPPSMNSSGRPTGPLDVAPAGLGHHRPRAHRRLPVHQPRRLRRRRPRAVVSRAARPRRSPRRSRASWPS